MCGFVVSLFGAAVFFEFQHVVVGWFRFSGIQQCVESWFRCLGDFEIMDLWTLSLGACNLLWCEFVFQFEPMTRRHSFSWNADVLVGRLS